jgi:tetratricopeptide (TPR) repeat protein
MGGPIDVLRRSSMRKTALFAVLLLVTASLLAAQDWKGKGRVSGYVYDEEGNPLRGVTVKLAWAESQTGFEVKSGKDGRWTAAWIRTGAWNIDFDFPGYAMKKITVNISEVAKNPDIEINLEKAAGPALTDDLKELLTKGNDFFDQGKYEDAAAAYQEILEAHPETYPVYLNLGNCYFAQEDYDKAEEQYLKVLEHDATNVDALVAIGNCYSNRDDSEKALEWYGKVEFEKISDPIVLYNLGTNYYNNSNFEGALKFYVKADEIQKNSPDTLYQLGLTYLNLQRNAESIASFESYLKIDPDSPRADQVRAFLDFLKKK